METREQERTVRTTFELPETLHREFKMTLLRERQTMQEFLEQLVARYVERERGKTEA